MSPLAETLNRFGAWLVEHLWHMSIELAILAGVVVAVIWLLRIQSPPLRHAFWCLVLAKPVATFLVASPISLYWFLRPPVIEVAPPPAPLAAVRPATPPIARPMMRYDMPRRIAAAEVVQPESLWRQFSWQGGIGLVWLGIALGFGVRLISGCAYVAFLRQTAQQQRDGPLAELVGEVTQSLGLRRRVAVAVSDVAHGPVLAGVIKPVILLPRHIRDDLSTHQVRLIIAHELAHVRRFDNLFLLIQRLAEMFLFFHPAVWLCGWAMRREAESACDDAVLSVYGGSTQYADSLTRVAEMRDGLTRRLLVNTFAAAESNFSQRVRRIFDGRVGRVTVRVAIGSIVALIIIGCVGLPTAAERKAIAQKEESPMSGKANVKTSQELGAALHREDGKVWIEGVPVQRGKNSVLAAMTSVLQAAGEDVTYEYLMGVSSRAFRLQFNWCPSAPHSGCGFNTFEPAMKAMGWTWTNYPMCNIGKQTVTAEEIAAARQAIERSIDSGLPCTFGSEEEGVLVGYEPAPQEAPGLLRRTDRPTPYHAPIKEYPWGVTVYRKGSEPAPSRRESILWSLTTAVKNAHTEKFDPGYTSGFAAWERWIAELSGEKKVHWKTDQDDPGKIVRIDQLDEGAYFSACLGNAWCYESLIDARQAAAKYLRSVAEEFSPEAGAHLTAAADHYEKVADTLKPAAEHARYPWQLKGQENWTESMRQAQTAALKEALAFERQAVAEIQAALTAEGVDANLTPSAAAETGAKMTSQSGTKGESAMTAQGSAGNTHAAAKVRHDGGRVWIDHVPALVWGKGKDCTFAGALEAALSVTEHPYSYRDIMGLAGLAFRVRWCNEDTKTKWCGSTAIGEMPDELAAIEKLTGWPLPTDVQFGVENPDYDAIRRNVVASIDAGKPVPAYASCLDVAVVYGYEDGGNTLLVSDYRKTERPFRLAAEKIGPLQTYLGPHSQPPSRRDALVEALKTAVVNWRRGHHDGGIKGREYLYGDAALHAWMRDLHDFDAVPDESRQAFFTLNRWNYQSLKDARLAAVAFLKAHASLLDGDAKAALERAAKLYEDELHRFESLERSDSRPWSATSSDQWTADMRNKERETLSEARWHEDRAIAQIEQALTAEGVDVSAVLAAVVGSAPTETTASKIAGPQTELKDYRWKPLWISQIGCLKAGLDYLGTDVSPSWLFGATGYAFLLNVHDALCPSGWHVVEMPVGKMGENAGYKLEFIVDVSTDKASKAERQKLTWDGVRKAIDAGVPCYGYDLEVGDYYTVHGYDDVGYYFAGPTCTGGKGPLAWRDYGVTGQVGIVHMCAIRAGKPADDRKTVTEALVWAVKHAQGATETHERYASGLAGYDQWIRALGSDQIEPHGTAYNAVCYLECRRNAVRFLTEARQRLDDELTPLFDEAIGRYEAVASSLEQVAEAFPWPPDAEHIKDQARRQKAIEALQAAKQAETQGVQALAKLARALGAEAELVAVAK